MKPELLTLPADPDSALTTLREASQTKPIVVFKLSPICPVSHRAESEFRAWLRTHDGEAVGYALVDVIAQKPLARGLTAGLNIQHQSPQALFFKGGELVWHDSHSKLTQSGFAGLVS